MTLKGYNPEPQKPDIDSYLAVGWKVISDTERGIQIQEPKKMNQVERGLILAGVLLLPLYGVGGLLLLAGIYGYYTRDVQTKFFPK